MSLVLHFLLFFLTIIGCVYSVVYGSGSRLLGASGIQLLELPR